MSFQKGCCRYHCHEAEHRELRAIKMRRLFEPAEKRGEFRRVRPRPRRAGGPEGLVTQGAFIWFGFLCV